MESALLENPVFAAGVLTIWILISTLAGGLVIYLMKREEVTPENVREQRYICNTVNTPVGGLGFLLVFLLVLATADAFGAYSLSILDFWLPVVVIGLLNGLTSRLAGRWMARGASKKWVQSGSGQLARQECDKSQEPPPPAG
jgi:hypothetical protein